MVQQFYDQGTGSWTAYKERERNQWNPDNTLQRFHRKSKIQRKQEFETQPATRSINRNTLFLHVLISRMQTCIPDDLTQLPPSISCFYPRHYPYKFAAKLARLVPDARYESEVRPEPVEAHNETQHKLNMLSFNLGVWRRVNPRIGPRIT